MNKKEQIKKEYDPKTAFDNEKILKLTRKKPKAYAGTVENTCICCGEKFKIHWEGRSNKYFAEVTDVCPHCFDANCSGGSKLAKNRYCNYKDRPAKKVDKKDIDSIDVLAYEFAKSKCKKH